MTALRNLLVHATNHLVVNGLINLDSGKDEGEPSGHAVAEIGGKLAVINWSGVGHGEIRISVWWDYVHEKYPRTNLHRFYKENFQESKPVVKSHHHPKFIGAMVSGWLGRGANKHLIGKKDLGLFDMYVRRDTRISLESLPEAKGIGFDAFGNSIL
ncbi:hypothetical protein [Candidatus Pantoea multigeneris]|uniref:Uncharacterized protein n=1 Tax=Candidatus Pantoea multigeneris TaxID=2608357 RepID=A0ABX0RBH2_9GAMM|nr:hypothetical protein [Pantoea multigeneris]NIF20590.1 hypothetical protein [Pantoea multigeneris]